MNERYAPQKKEAGKRPAVSEMPEVADMRVWPALLSHLCLEVWPDGTSRETSTLTIFGSDGGLKGCVRDRANSLVAFMTADSVTGLLTALEEGLVEDSLDWRPEKPAGSRRR